MNYISVLLDNPKVEASYFGTFIALPLYSGHLRPNLHICLKGGRSRGKQKWSKKSLIDGKKLY